jgi:hypothetical protein
MRACDALITGFVKSPAVAELSLAPLLALQARGHVRDIHYMTWDDPALDPWVAPVAAHAQVRVTRVPQPDARGTANQRGIVYQVENLKAALAQVADPDGLILKSRLDFIADANFLEEKIVNFDELCAPVSRTAANGVTMPAPMLENKIWIPWADSNQPFFYEDAMFLGRRRDIEKLATPLTAEDFAVLGEPDRGSYAHVVRFAKIFTPTWTLFDDYLRHYRCFVNNLDYRARLIQLLVDDGFFWHVMIGHAWILYSQFHVDIGEPGDLLFFANNVNQQADWSRPERLKLANPYDDIANWRANTQPGKATASVSRAYGRLMDDAWAAALFRQPMPDFPPDMLRQIMENVAGHRDGRLSEIEGEFYRKLDRFCATAWPQARAKMMAG